MTETPKKTEAQGKLSMKSMADRARQKMMLSLVDSLTSISGETMPPEYRALIEIFLSGSLQHKNEPKFHAFLEAELRKLTEAVRSWKGGETE